MKEMRQFKRLERILINTELTSFTPTSLADAIYRLQQLSKYTLIDS